MNDKSGLDQVLEENGHHVKTPEGRPNRGTRGEEVAAECQSALNFDPLSASNIDPCFDTVEVVPVVHRGDPRGFV